MKPFNLDEYLKNPSKKLVTSGGREVKRILCTDARGVFPIVALVDCGNYDDVIAYTKEGGFYSNNDPSMNDLFFAPEKYEGWVNVYRDFDGLMCGSLFATEEDAKHNAKTAIATVKIEWEE